MESGQIQNIHEVRQFRVTSIEPCRRDSVVSNGVIEARNSALALIAEQTTAKGESCAIKDGSLISRMNLAGKHNLVGIGIIAWVTEVTPTAATC
jgi:hypothetical protein